MKEQDYAFCLFAVVRQQFVLGNNCWFFLYLNTFGASQSLALTRKSFRIAQVLLCAVQQVLAPDECSAVRATLICLLKHWPVIFGVLFKYDVKFAVF